MRRAALAALIVCATALPSVAMAQAPGQAPSAPPSGVAAPAERAPQPRRGFIVGVALGPGTIEAVDPSDDTTDSLGGFSVNLHIGGMITPRFAVVAELWGVFHEDSELGAELTFTHNIFAIAGQYWLTPRLWLKGGLGRANYTVIQDDATYEGDDVPALMGAVGYELSHSRSFALDVQARVGAAEYEGGELRSGAVVLGLNWF